MGDRTSQDRAPLWRLPLIVSVAIAARVWRWVDTDAIFADGPRFIEIAQAAGAGEWTAVFADDFHPLYPVLTAAVQPWFGDWENAAASVSIASGALAVVFLHGFVRDAYGAQPAWIAAAILALHPRVIDFSSDVQSEGLYLAMFLGALWAGWRVLSSSSVRAALACGCLAGLAYLVRPEGLGPLALVGLLGFVEVFRRRIAWRPALACALALGAGVVFTAAPYVWSLSDASGSLTLTQKKSVGALLGMDERRRGGKGRLPAPSASLPGIRVPKAERIARETDALAAAKSLGKKSIKVFRYEVLLLFLVGLWSVRGHPGLRGRFHLLLVAMYGVVLFGLAMSSGYVSRRHCLPALVPLFGYAAVGVPVLGRFLAEQLRVPSRLAWAPVAVGLSFVVVGSGIELAETRGERHLVERLAGESIARTAATTRPIVATPRRYAAYYAGAQHVPIQPTPYTLDSARLRAAGTTHVVLVESVLEPDEWAEVLSQPALEVLDRFEANGRSALVIAVGPATIEPMAVEAVAGEPTADTVPRDVTVH
jgi:4-amino-4-deoxy-L-arabinose transferase-like glycosyltransferase